jgi:hypothetical protein
MFLEELQPIAKEFTKDPIAFLGGFASSVLRLNLSEEPVKSWLDQQVSSPDAGGSSSPDGDRNGNNNGPQTITID